MGRVAKPQVAFEQGDQLRRQEAPLRRELHRLLAQVLEAVADGVAEEDDGLGSERAVLRGAEGQHVHPCVAGHVAEFAAERCRGVREARAVHVQQQVAGVRGVCKRAQLRRRVDRAELAGLGDRHDAGLHGVLVADALDHRGDIAGRELAVRRRRGEQLEAAHPLRRAALVDRQVRGLRAHDSLPGLQASAQRRDVRAGPVENEERFAARPEPVAQQLGGARRPGVVAIRLRVVGVGLGDRGEDLGMDAGVVVRPE